MFSPEYHISLKLWFLWSQLVFSTSVGVFWEGGLVAVGAILLGL